MLGGAGAVGVRLAAALPRRGFDCVAWVPGPGPASAALENERIPVQFYDLAATRRGALPHTGVVARMALGLARMRRPIVHVHNPTVFRLLWPGLAASRARTVVHFHIEPTRDEIDYALRFTPDRVVACAGYIAAIIRKECHSPLMHPVETVPNAVDIETYHPPVDDGARRRVGLETNRFVLLTMANLAPHKGQATVMRAVQLLRARGVPVEYWLAGEDRSLDGIHERELRALGRELQITDYVRFLGMRTDGPELLRAADAFVLPSSHEGLPLSVLEAQASGVPVVGSSIPGIRELVVDGETGLLIEATDFTGCADTVQMLYRHPERRRQIAVAAARIVKQKHAWAVFENRMVQIYQSLE
jgi:glycosyltransferase involved in cell wall biosynthesis